MKILITGSSGFLGQRLISRLVESGRLCGRTISCMDLVDRVETVIPDVRGISFRSFALDLSESEALDEVLDRRPDVIFHLAAVVSSAAEADLDLGMSVNFDVTRRILEGCRTRELYQTRLVMASSVAVYGGELPDRLDDMTALQPESSYGTQKAMCELLINDFSRRGLIDGRVLRLPTIVVRPGRPNAAASSFASSIIREPLKGEKAVCPVPIDQALFVMSPGKVIEALVHGAELAGPDIGRFRALMLPGITVTVEQMLATLREFAGPKALDLVSQEPDAKIQSIISSWPARFDTEKAYRLGFSGDNNFREIIENYLDLSDQRR